MWSKPEYFGWRLGLPTSWEELFGALVGDSLREMGLLRPCISEPEVPTETFPAETIYMCSQPR